MDDTELVIKKPRLLSDSFKCTFCLQFATPPILSCKNEHLVCSKCYLPWKEMSDGLCGTCRGEISVNCKTLEQIGECISAKCTYNCGKTIPLTEHDKHQSECDLRPTYCFIGCDVAFSSSRAMIKHLKSKHDLFEIEQWTKGKFSVNSSYAFLLKPGSAVDRRVLDTSLYYIKHNKDEFIVEENISATHVQFVVRLVGTPIEAEKYRAKVSVCGDNMVNKISYVTLVNTFRESASTIEDKGQAAIVPVKTILQWTRDPASRPHEYEVSIKIRDMKLDLRYLKN